MGNSLKNYIHNINLYFIAEKVIYYMIITVTIDVLMYWQFKLGMSFMKLAFNMESWEACGGGAELSGEEALAVGNKYIDKALEIFEEVSLVNLYRI